MLTSPVPSSTRRLITLLCSSNSVTAIRCVGFKFRNPPDMEIFPLTSLGLVSSTRMWLCSGTPAVTDTDGTPHAAKSNMVVLSVVVASGGAVVCEG